MDLALLGIVGACGGSNLYPDAAPDAEPDAAQDAFICELGFSSVQTPQASNSGFGIAAGDIDGDSILDLVASPSGGPVDVLRGLSGGLFADATQMAFNGRSVALGRFDAGATLDLALTDGDAVVVRLGNGNGTFGAPASYATGASPWDLLAVDLDKDGDLDLVTPNLTAQSVSVLLNDGNGTFATSAYQTDVTPYTVAAGFLDDDTVLDLAIAAGGTNGNITVLRGIGDGTFAAGFNVTTVVGSPYGVAVADLDADGHGDLVYTTSSSAFAVRRGNGTMTFTPPTAYGPSTSAMGIAVADIDTDGKLDVLTGQGNIAWFRGRGDATFEAPLLTMVQSPPDRRKLLVADFDHEGMLDVAGAGYFAPNVLVAHAGCANGH